MIPKLTAVCLFLAASISMAAEPARMPNVSSAVMREIAAKGKTRVLVRLDESADPSLIEKASIKGWRMQSRLKTLPYMIGEVDADGLNELAGNPAVDQVFEDLPVRGSLAQSVPVITADVARTKYGLTGNGIVVGFIDTGIDLTHADLANAVIAKRRILNGVESNDVQDDNGHGTHLAGIITGNGTIASRGVAPDCKLVVIKALDNNNAGMQSDLIKAVDWIIDHRSSYPTIKFICLAVNFTKDPSTLCPCNSLVQTEPSYQATIDAIARAKTAGILIVVPTGNSGGQGLIPPACFNDVIAVGSTFDAAFMRAPTTGTYHDFSPLFPSVYDYNTTTRMIAGFSNYGTCMDFVAPGYSITSDKLTGGTLNSFGTSMSVAHVVGALALLQQRSPKSTGAQLVAILKANGKSVPDPVNSTLKYPLVDVAATAAKLGTNKAQSWTVYR